MRLFFAINLPAGEQERLHRAVARLRTSDLPVRWVPPQNLHLTIRFIGSVEARRIEDLRRAGARAAAAIAPFEARLGGIGAFPNTRRPRVIWVGVQKAEPLLALHAALEQALAPLGFAPENRAFEPHITLGRVRDGARPSDFARLEELTASVHYAGILPVRSLDLMHSELGPGGARYVRIGAAPLG